MYVIDHFSKLCDIAKQFAIGLQNHDLCNVDTIKLYPDDLSLRIDYNEIKSKKINKSIKDEIYDIVKNIFDQFLINATAYNQNTLEFSVCTLIDTDNGSDDDNNEMLGSIYVEIDDYHMNMYIPMDSDIIDKMND